ncbi:MAG TPA: type II toxin-antitoxin system YafQ family toxin [Ancylobacter sp.]
MREIEPTTRFRRDYKREKRTDAKLDDLLEPIINKLANDEILPPNLADHSLGADWKGFRDCHIKPDLVLIYQKQEGVLSLVRLGSHSELFG